MFPLFLMPGWMQTVSNVSPVKWGILALEGGIWRELYAGDEVRPWRCILAFGVAGCRSRVEDLANETVTRGRERRVESSPCRVVESSSALRLRSSSPRGRSSSSDGAATCRRRRSVVRRGDRRRAPRSGTAAGSRDSGCSPRNDDRFSPPRASPSRADAHGSDRRRDPRRTPVRRLDRRADRGRRPRRRAGLGTMRVAHASRRRAYRVRRTRDAAR